jgi:hypothetical protein
MTSIDRKEQDKRVTRNKQEIPIKLHPNRITFMERLLRGSIGLKFHVY